MRRSPLSVGTALVFLLLTVLGAPRASQEPPAEACGGEAHRQFDFWQGSWVVYGPDGQVAGRNEIEPDLGGCVLREHWQGAGGLEGRSVNLFHAPEEAWHQTWVDSAGSLLRLDGGLDEDRMVLTGREPSRRDPEVTVFHRIAWEPMPRGMVYQRWRASRDDGATWIPLFDGLYVPEGASASIVEAPGETGRVEVAPGVELHYRIVGEGPTLVVPIGRITDGIAPLAETHRLVLYDPRGRGRSTPYSPEMELSLETELSDLDAILRHLDAERVTLLGISYYGGLVALYAAEHPDQVDRVVMVGPIAPTAEQFLERAVETDPRETADSRRFAELEAEGAAESDPIGHCLAYRRAHVHDLVADAASYEGDASSCWLPNERPSRFLAWAQGLFSTVGRWDWTGQARRVNVPALVLYGEEDRITPPQGARTWGELLPEARVVPVPGSGHLPLSERPEVALPAIQEFLAAAPPG